MPYPWNEGDTLTAADLNDAVAQGTGPVGPVGPPGPKGDKGDPGTGGGSPTGPASGDLAGTYPAPVLAASGVATGTYGDSTHVARISVDTKGRLTSASSVLISSGGGGGAPTGPAGGDLSGTYPNPTVATVGGVAGPFLPLSGGIITGPIGATSILHFDAPTVEITRGSISSTASTSQGFSIFTEYRSFATPSTDIDISSGYVEDATSGVVSLRTGNATGTGSTGNIGLTTGNAGDALAGSGSIILRAGTAVDPGNRGNVELYGQSIYTDSPVTIGNSLDVTGRVTFTQIPPAATVSASAPASPVQGMLWYDSVGGQLYVRYGVAWVIAFNIAGASVSYAQMPSAVQKVPIAFPFSGKPAASAVINVPMSMAVTVAASLAGTVAYASTNTTASATFAVNKISSGSTTALGTVVKTTGSTTSITLAGAGGSLAIGDVLQVVAPSSQDATLSDIGISILCNRT